MRVVTTSDGVEVASHDLGGSGRPTLFAHATGFHGLIFRALASELATECRSFAVDFRAHGASTVPPGADLRWAVFGLDTAATLGIDELRAEPVVGIGHSMGGAALVMAEAARPGSFAAMFLFEPVIPPAQFGAASRSNQLADGAARRRQVFPSRAEALANYSSKPPLNSLRSDVLADYVEHGFVDLPDGAVTLACRSEDEANVFRGAPTDLFPLLEKVRCPVIVGQGDPDGGASGFAKEVAAALPNGRLERFPGANHFAPLQDPPRVAAVIRELLTAL